ncbi:hypothetical protein Leryth_019889 [Lithospermum erythrorhizon]|nr:hypothetical protein Leryth_019889 [Lithospermum erythrorhizon]
MQDFNMKTSNPLIRSCISKHAPYVLQKGLLQYTEMWLTCLCNPFEPWYKKKDLHHLGHEWKNQLPDLGWYNQMLDHEENHQMEIAIYMSRLKL